MKYESDSVIKMLKNKINQSLQILLICLFFSSCVTTELVKQTKDENDIREAIFRYLIDGFDPSTNCFYLSMSDISKPVDPSDVFLARFSDLKGKSIKKISECSYAKNDVIDKRTNEHGIILSIWSIQLKSKEEAEVHAGYYQANESASSGEYQVRKIKGKWSGIKAASLTVAMR